MDEVEAIWILADVMNGMMVIPNLIALVALGGLVMRLATGNDEHDEKDFVFKEDEGK